MRFLLKASIPVQAWNKSAKEGRLAETIKSLLDDLKSKAANFIDGNGPRTGCALFCIGDNSQITKAAEPRILSVRAQDPGF